MHAHHKSNHPKLSDHPRHEVPLGTVLQAEDVAAVLAFAELSLFRRFCEFARTQADDAKMLDKLRSTPELMAKGHADVQDTIRAIGCFPETAVRFSDTDWVRERFGEVHSSILTGRRLGEMLGVNALMVAYELAKYAHPGDVGKQLVQVTEDMERMAEKAELTWAQHRRRLSTNFGWPLDHRIDLVAEEGVKFFRLGPYEPCQVPRCRFG